jgi:hypothetical protein
MNEPHRAITPHLPVFNRFIPALLAVGLGACADIDTDIVIDAEEILHPCLRERFPWRVRMGTLSLAADDMALLKFEASEGPPTFDDSMAFIISDGHTLTDEGSGTVVVAPTAEHERGQGTILLAVSCPDENAAFWVFDGELVFDRVVARSGEEVSGHFEGVLLDGHQLDQVAATGVTIDFRFPFKSWRPFQVFSPMP